MEKIKYIFPDHIKERIEFCLQRIKEPAEEIRLARDRPVFIRTASNEYTVSDKDNKQIISDTKDMEHILCVALEHSMYMKEDEINRGFLTLKGGYRIGVCGTVSYVDGRIVHHGEITSLNIRFQREVIGCAKEIASRICSEDYVQSSIIISRPKKGKTTMLRDIARILSDEKRLRVGIVDERKELWGMGDFSLGNRCDVICGCKKHDGIMMLLRTMSPDVIIVDELGGEDDIKAIQNASVCGVPVIASIHGKGVESIRKKGIGDCFECCVVLGEKYGEFRIYKGEGAS